MMPYLSEVSHIWSCDFSWSRFLVSVTTLWELMAWHIFSQRLKTWTNRYDMICLVKYSVRHNPPPPPTQFLVHTIFTSEERFLDNKIFWHNRSDMIYFEVFFSLLNITANITVVHMWKTGWCTEVETSPSQHCRLQTQYSQTVCHWVRNLYYLSGADCYCYLKLAQCLRYCSKRCLERN